MQLSQRCYLVFNWMDPMRQRTKCPHLNKTSPWALLVVARGTCGALAPSVKIEPSFPTCCIWLCFTFPCFQSPPCCFMSWGRDEHFHMQPISEEIFAAFA